MTGWCNRRTLGVTLLIVAAAMLQGCVYDPYIGAYVPCCTYPTYGYSGYPAYGSYGGSVVIGGGWGGGYYRGGYGWYH
jgi:hypothetical protein